MKLPGEAKRLRAYVDETDQLDGRPVYELIVELAKEHGIAGATVLRGVLGYGAHSRIHSSKILRLSESLPMVIEIIDAAARIDPFMAVLDGLIAEGLVTVEPVHVTTYRPETSA
jgi:PII-like signaling protein